MRNAGGYSQLICDEPKKAVAFDRQGRVITQECDTFTCGHCCVVVFVRPQERPEDVGGLCKQCMKLICPGCTDNGRCTPFEKRLARAEARLDALRSYGLT
jgi:hypothetical protein